MKIELLILYLFIFSNSAFSEGPKQLISCHVNDISFDEFSAIIYKKSQVRIFYDKFWVNNIKVSINRDSITVESAVKLALKGTKLEVSVWYDNLILFPGEKLIMEIPKYELEQLVSKDSVMVVDDYSESEDLYIKGRKADVLQTIEVGNRGSMNRSATKSVRARISDKENGEAISNAIIFIEEINVKKVSDENGYFNLGVKSGLYNIAIECMGFEKKKCLIEVISDGSFKIEMEKEVLAIEEVLVQGDKQMDIKSRDPGMLKISTKTIKEIPTMMGERDILKVSEMLPGIVTVGEGSAGLNVRGGNSDQNAFYVNKVPIYNTAHMFGFFPAFNSDMIKDFSIYKGHIPARFGGRLSSVFDIETYKGNRKQLTLHGAINPITASLTAGGPLKKDVASVIISARTSYSDWLLSKIPNPNIRTSKANFYDFSGAVNYDLKQTQLSAFIYHSYDFFKLSDISEYSYSNNGASLNARHIFNSTFWGEFTLIGAQYSFETTDQQLVSAAYQHKYKINHFELHADFEQQINDKNILKYGASFDLYKLNRGMVEPYGAESLKKVVNLGKEQGVENAIYISDFYKPLPWMQVTLGFRYVLYSSLGPKTVYSYAEDLPPNEQSIVDSMDFGKNAPVKWYSEPEIRAVLSFDTDSRGSVKVAFNQMHQNLFMLSNTISISPNSQWKLADYYLHPSSGNQLSLGVFRSFLDGVWESSVELFLKKTRNVTEFKDGADFLASPNAETIVLQGNQQAYGIEFFLKKGGKKLDGWLSYTYSRSSIIVDDKESFNRINKGEAYPSNYDIPHSVNTAINYHLTRRVTFSTVLNYQTGRPITYPIGVYYIEGVAYTDYSKRNAYRIPDYFRVDLSLALEGNLKKRKLIHSSWLLNVYNLTGRKNPYSVYFESENGKISSYKYSVIGVPFFTISWLFKFGNYASD